MLETILNKNITNATQFYEVLLYLCDELDKGNLEQFICSGDIFCTKEDVHLFVQENSFPDIVRCYFRDLKTGDEYLLEVETYHGAGGTLKKILKN